MNLMQYLKVVIYTFLLFLITTIAAGQDINSCYKATKVAENVWAIVEDNVVNIYLVEGKDSALIIDTGYGVGDLKAYVQTLTKLPLIVVNTHGHWDHSGNDHQFAKVYVHPDDFSLIIDTTYNKKRRRTTLLARTKNRNLTDEQLDAMINAPLPVLVPVKEGHIFDLGDRKLEVIEVPGHTHGSICLLDSENKILFAGDNTNAIVWLFLKDCYPLEVYLKSLQKVEKRIDEFDIIMPGHNTPLDKTFIYEQIACVKSILDGTCSPVPYNFSPLTAGAYLCKYKTSEVAYDPDNLWIKK